jgi:hypothetical protein
MFTAKHAAYAAAIYLGIIGLAEMYSDASPSNNKIVDTLATLPSPGSMFPGSSSYWDLALAGISAGAAYWYL